MIKHYFKIVLRNLWRNKTYSFINIFGLTLGLICFLLIALYVFDELTYDSFHTNASNTYRVVETRISPEGKESKVAAVGYKIAEQSPVSIPEVKKAARFTALGRTNVSDPAVTNTFYESFSVANPEYLQVFDFKLIEGNRTTALAAPRSVILTEETAKKIFGVSSVVGRTLKTDTDSLPYTITGILQNFPSNSHISFNLLFSESSISNQRYKDFISADWNSNNYTTYLMLDKEADAAKATQKLSQLIAANRNSNSKMKSSLIACINYMNLTTARFANRGKEIAVRKVTGALRSNLVGQFLSEALLMAIIALVLSLGATKLLLPAFNSFTQKQLDLGLTTDPRIWFGIVATVFIVGLFAGAYPALFQSRLKPLLLLKNKIQQSKGQLSLRKGLVVFQFFLSIIMIVSTIVVFMQMKYVDTADMGFNKEQLLVVDINSGAVRRGAETIKTEYAKVAAVKSVSVTSRVPGEWKIIPKVKAKMLGSNDVENDMFLIAADDQFLKTFEVSLSNGSCKNTWDQRTFRATNRNTIC